MESSNSKYSDWNILISNDKLNLTIKVYSALHS